MFQINQKVSLKTFVPDVVDNHNQDRFTAIYNLPIDSKVIGGEAEGQIEREVSDFASAQEQGIEQQVEYLEHIADKERDKEEEKEADILERNEEGEQQEQDQSIQYWEPLEEDEEEDPSAQDLQSSQLRDHLMILLFLFIYILHAILLILLIQYLFTDALLTLSNILYSVTEHLLDFLQYLYSWLVGEHLVLQHFILFPTEYLHWYLTPIRLMKESTLGRVILKIENAYVIGILTVVICLVVDNYRSYKKLCELARNLETFDEQCPICLEDLITPNEEAEKIKCNHYFHNSCLSKWIMNPNDRPNEPRGCPVCRQPLV